MLQYCFKNHCLNDAINKRYFIFYVCILSEFEICENDHQTLAEIYIQFSLDTCQIELGFVQVSTTSAWMINVWLLFHVLYYVCMCLDSACRYHFYLDSQVMIIGWSIRILEGPPFQLSYDKIRNIKTVKKFVYHLNKTSSFRNFITSNKPQCLTYWFTEHLPIMYNLRISVTSHGHFSHLCS